MITEQLEIVSVFFDDINRELTINQISKLIRKSYAYTNKNAHELIQCGMMKKKVVGSSILCSLNIANEETGGLLMLASIKKKVKLMSDERHARLRERLDELSQVRADIKYYDLAKKGFVVVSDLPVELPSGLKADVITSERFRIISNRLDLGSIVIIEGYERFWKLVGEMRS